uniref:Uncharacterized protein n=1 Tax=Anguilla anguilla TaxID=7936 RepID=A0A0E9U668_ANGAN
MSAVPFFFPFISFWLALA